MDTRWELEACLGPVGLASRHDVLRPSRPLTVGQIEEMLEPTAWALAPTGPVLTAA